MSIRSRFDLWWENAVTRAVRRTMETPIIGRAARRIVREERYGRISARAAAPAGITKLRRPKARLPKPLPLPYQPITMTSTPSTPVRRAPARRTPARKSPAKAQAQAQQQPVIHVHLPPGMGYQQQGVQQVAVPASQGTQQPMPIQSSGMSVDQVAALITRTLAAKGGTAIEISALTQHLGTQGIPPQAVQAALWGAHSAGWVKKSGRGKIAATAKSVRAGGVPTTNPRRRAG